MLSVHPSNGGDRAKHYFFAGLVHGDAHAEGQERAGRWWGAGAELLGLEGPVQTKQFCRLVDNCHPVTRERLTLRNKAIRRAGYDLLFSPPKSFSVVALLRRDQRLLDAHEQAVEFTLRAMEQSVQTRVRKDGEMADRYTGNLIVALFTHLTARPEAGQLPDPLVHTHAYTINSTKDPVEACWKAVQFGGTKNTAPYFEALYHNELARLVRAAGYEIERRGIAWEVVGVPMSVVARLSKRGERIEEVAARKAIEDPAKRARLAVLTRKGKAPEHTLDELRRDWWRQLDPSEARTLRNLKPGDALVPDRESAQHQRDAARLVRSVASHVFERSSSVRLKACSRFALGTPRPSCLGGLTELRVRGRFVLVV